MTKNVKSGAPPCGIYLKIRNSGKKFTLIETIKQICLGINASSYERNMHVFEYTGKVDPKIKDYVTALKEFLQSQGMVFIIREDIKFAEKIKADGVIVKTFADAVKARKILGKDTIIGLRLTCSRNKLERALNSDIDYISLPLNPKKTKMTLQLLNAWAMVSDKPCLIEGNISNNDCMQLIAAGATFIDASNYILKNPKGVLQAVVNMLYAIDIAIPETTKH